MAPKIVKNKKATIKPTPGISDGIPNLFRGMKGLNILSAIPTTTPVSYTHLTLPTSYPV